MKKKLAIVGSGIAGLGILHKLSHHYEITLFETNNYLGGHTNTLSVEDGSNQISIDSGFMVFNETTYPHLTELFRTLDVATVDTDMSFSVQDRTSDVEWSGTGIKRFFARQSNFWKPGFYRMLFNISKFNDAGLRDVGTEAIERITVREYLEKNEISLSARKEYILPMMSSLWSANESDMLDFPIQHLLRFMQTHGLLSTYGQLQWKTVVGGASQYVGKLKQSASAHYKLQARVVEVRNTPGHNVSQRAAANGTPIVVKTEDGSSHYFDKCVIATHADQAAKLLDRSMQQNDELFGLLSNFRYQENQVSLHTDSSVMPQSKGNWASWNYLLSHAQQSGSVHYWMNSLQPLRTKTNYFISLNSDSFIAHSKIKKQLVYEHPVFSVACLDAQKQLRAYNQNSANLFFCGSYFDFGFHEDALLSSYQVAEILNREEHLTSPAIAVSER
ncbi:MAG: NADP transhydrogenase subunit alpha [Cyanobacteria bacterium PR.3.49]|nr:NADP transhydrogenase subunit alpha [Cyanobacteria bacterium PR.3.49]